MWNFKSINKTVGPRPPKIEGFLNNDQTFHESTHRKLTKRSVTITSLTAEQFYLRCNTYQIATFLSDYSDPRSSIENTSAICLSIGCPSYWSLGGIAEKAPILKVLQNAPRKGSRWHCIHSNNIFSRQDLEISSGAVETVFSSHPSGPSPPAPISLQDWHAAIQGLPQKLHYNSTETLSSHLNPQSQQWGWL